MKSQNESKVILPVPIKLSKLFKKKFFFVFLKIKNNSPLQTKMGDFPFSRFGHSQIGQVQRGRRQRGVKRGQLVGRGHFGHTYLSKYY